MYYYQEKLNTNHQLNSTCELNLQINSDSINYKGVFFMEFKKNLVPYGITFIHKLDIDKKSGDFFISFKIINRTIDNSPYRNTYWVKKNSFPKLLDLTELGFYRGEKRENFWGAKYNKTILNFFYAIKDNLQSEFKGSFLEKKEYWYCSVVNGLYDLITDYHLHKKKIKFHNNVYNDILVVYPKKKWLKINDNKFLPAVLDEYEIKSKYLIKELSTPNVEISPNIKALIYLCTLFGKNYVDYIKKFNWRSISCVSFKKIKKHKCRNENEKKSIIRSFYSSHKETPPGNNTLSLIYSLFEMRRFLEDHGYKKLNIKLQSAEDLTSQLEIGTLMKMYYMSGYMLRYKISEDIIKDIETPIETNNKIFCPKVLLSNEDFCNEGITMKNCMGRQFAHGAIHLFLSLSTGKKRINIEYDKGSINMAYAKANTPVPEDIFKDALIILTNRILKYKDLKWEKEKYSIKNE